MKSGSTIATFSEWARELLHFCMLVSFTYRILPATVKEIENQVHMHEAPSSFTEKNIILFRITFKRKINEKAVTVEDA
jgi:hypothetical protein